MDKLPQNKRRPSTRSPSSERKSAASRKATQRYKDRFAVVDAVHDPENAPDRILIAMISMVKTDYHIAVVGWREIGRRYGLGLWQATKEQREQKEQQGK